MFMDNTEEIWKTYPEFDFIEASNLGRVRTKDHYVMRKDGREQFVKGHILKQRDNGHGYMRVQFGVGCKKVDRYVHRIIAESHIPNPKNLPEVNHRDNNRANNAVSNLEWCTHQYNEAYKKNFGTSQAELLGKTVFAVNLETFKVLHFETQAEVARQLGIETGHINRVLKGKLQQAGGYLFTEDESNITKEKIQKIKSNMHFLGDVIAVNLITQKVFHFKSQHEAGCQLGINANDVCAVLKGRLRQAGGYLFVKNTNEITKDKLQEIMSNIKHKAILAINLETQKVLYFKSQRETSRQLKISRRSICSVLKGQRNQIGNYYFCYVDENAIKNIREKFGDKLANEVKELIKKCCN